MIAKIARMITRTHAITAGFAHRLPGRVPVKKLEIRKTHGLTALGSVDLNINTAQKKWA